MRLRSWQEGLAVGGAMLWVVCWGLWAVISEQRPSAEDAVFPFASAALSFLHAGQLDQVGAWLHTLDYYPPLPALLTALLAMAMDDVTLASARLVSLILHVVLLVQLYLLGRRLATAPWVPLLAVALAALTPIIAGWFRLDFPEPLVAVFVLGSLHQALRTDLRRPGPALLLGLWVGLGSLTKLTFPLVMLAPALLFVALRLRRDRRILAGGALALVTVLLVGGWWYLLKFEVIVLNFFMSTHQGRPLAEKVAIYFGETPDHLVLTLLAALGLVLCWRRRTVARDALLLLGSAWGTGLAALVLVFDVQHRYVLPILPLACLLGALGLGTLARRAPRAGHLVAGLVPLAALAYFLGLSLAPAPAQRAHRFEGHGLVNPHRGDLRALCRARRGGPRPRQRPTLVHFSGRPSFSWSNDLVYDCSARHDLPLPLNYRERDWDDALRRAGSLGLARVRFRRPPPDEPPTTEVFCDVLGPWLAEQELHPLGVYEDDSPFLVEVFEVTRR